MPIRKLKTGSHKGKRSAKNKKTGKYVKQRARTTANKKKRILRDHGEKALSEWMRMKHLKGESHDT